MILFHGSKLLLITTHMFATGREKKIWKF